MVETVKRTQTAGKRATFRFRPIGQLSLASSLAIALMLSLIPMQAAALEEPAREDVSDIEGDYWTPEHDGIVRIYERGGRLYGKIIWEKVTHRDQNNPNPKLRNRTIRGIKIIKRFAYADGEWVDGRIYSPKHGKNYRGKIWLEGSNKLRMRGYLGLPVFGKTVTFTRVQRYPDPSLRPSV